MQKKNLKTKVLLINSISISRIVISVLPFFSISCFEIFVVSIYAAISDFLDGFLSRYLNSSSKTGAQIDQLSDKIFHFSFFVFYTLNGEVHLYFLVLFLLREITILILRYVGLCRKDSSMVGKIKSALSYIYIIYLGYICTYSPDNNYWYISTSFEIIIILTGFVSLLTSFKK